MFRVDLIKVFLKPEYLGFAASKKSYFYEIKVHRISRPIEVQYRPGVESDVHVLWTMELDIPSHSLLSADGAYHCFDGGDVLRDKSILFHYNL